MTAKGTAGAPTWFFSKSLPSVELIFSGVTVSILPLTISYKKNLSIPFKIYKRAFAKYDF
jgi:hypothetical protein